MARLRAAGVMALAVAISLVVPATSAGATTSPVVAAQFNLGGWKLHSGSLAPAKTVVQQVKRARPRPTVVSLAEVCSGSGVVVGGQFEYVRAQLAAMGYAAVFAPSVTTPIGPGCDRFGNALAVRGLVTSSTSRTYDAQNPSRFGERRNIVCVRVVTVTGSLGACGTHLVPSSDGGTTTRQQSDEARAFVDAEFGAGPRLVAGDLNLYPSDPALDAWYASYFEGDESNRLTPQATLDSGSKLDYVFGDQASFEAATGATAVVVATSDHHWYSARFTPRPPR